MDNNTLYEIYNSRYNQIRQEYELILSDRQVISNLLSDFVINGTQVGSDTYGYSISLGGDISLPDDDNQYSQVIGAIDGDIGNIDTLITAITNFTSSIQEEAIKNDELDQIYDSALSIRQELAKMEEERVTVREQLKSIYNMLRERHANTLDGAGGGEGGSNGNGNGSEYQPKKPDDKDTKKQETPSNAAVDETTGKINNLTAKIEKNKSNISKMMDDLSLGGSIDADHIYSNSDFSDDSVVIDANKMNFTMLLIESDIEDTKNLVVEIERKIAENEKKIEENKASIEKNKALMAETKIETDADGVEHEVPAHDNAALQAEIDKWVAENEKLAAENVKLKQNVVAYNEDIVKKEALSQRINEYNEKLSQVNKDIKFDDVLDDLINAVIDGDGKTLYGIEVTDDMLEKLYQKLLDDPNYRVELADDMLMPVDDETISSEGTIPERFHKYDPDTDGRSLADIARNFKNYDTTYKSMCASEVDGVYEFGCAGFVAYIYNMILYGKDSGAVAQKSEHYNGDEFDESVLGLVGSCSSFFGCVCGEGDNAAGNRHFNDGFDLVGYKEAKPGDVVIWVDGKHSYDDVKDLLPTDAIHAGILYDVNEKDFFKSTVIHSTGRKKIGNGVCESTIKKYNDVRGGSESVYVLRYTGNVVDVTDE